MPVGTIVVPFWPSAHYWPLITNKCHKYVKACSFQVGNQSLVHGRKANFLRGSKDFKGYVVAVKMEFIDLSSMLLSLICVAGFAESGRRSLEGLAIVYWLLSSVRLL